MSFVQPLVMRHNGVRLEPLALSHEDGLRAAAADGELWKLRITSVPEPHETRAYIETALKMREDGHRFAFAVVDDATGTVLGTTSYHDILPAVKRVEIGWTWYRKSAQRSHVNTTCKRLLLGHAFERLGMRTVYFHTSHQNLRSQAAIERLGAKRDGVIRQHRRQKDGSLRDTVCYSIVDAEWLAMRARLDARLAP